MNPTTMPGGTLPPNVPNVPSAPAAGIALLAVLFALTLLAMLALPFAVSMSVGADASVRAVESAQVEQASASARDLLLADVALSHPSLDETPAHDGLDEYPDLVAPGQAFAALREEGRVQLGGEVWDLQRYAALDGASPLLLANVLGATARLREDLLPEATVMLLDDADRLPDSGYVWLAHEVIRYGSKRGNELLELERNQLLGEGFVERTSPVAATALVLDLRCVLAAAWPFLGRGDGARTARRPFAAVGELAEIAQARLGAFTTDELDRFAATLSAHTLSETTSVWSRPERVFDGLRAGDRWLRVRSALHLGPGSTVRLRNLATGESEYGLVMSAATERSTQDLLLPQVFVLGLLHPVGREFPGTDTVVEALIPAPVNANTASAAVLAALAAEIRRAFDVRVPDAQQRQRSTPPLPISRGQAEELAEQIVASRSDPSGAPGTGPLTGWRDLAERCFQPRFGEASDAQKAAWINLYRNFETGRDSHLEMGTAPLSFRSGPWVGYRAAASRSRSTAALGIAARHERTGLAAVVPGFQLERRWDSQVLLEEAFRLDRRAPYYTTRPINVGAILPNDAGNDPAPRYAAHLLSMAYPGAGFGAPRFPSPDAVDAAFGPAPAMVRLGGVPGQASAWESCVFESDPRGFDVTRDGAYRITNSGPRGRAAGAGVEPAPTAGQAAGRGRHDRIALPFSEDGGFAARFAVSFWAEPQTLEGTTLLDHSDGDDERNRLALHGRDGNLVLEVIDEAGLDPDPSQSPAGVERTASQWSLPLAELGLPADTPVHLSASATSGRPSDLTLFVDGVVRGKPRYVTRLAAALPQFDPTLGSNNTFPPTGSNERYLDVQVESTEGFPSVGILRIGTELFEYTAISGNTFQCQWRDSIGGRGARQMAREHRPDVPLDQNGRPTVDIDSLAASGVNLDVFPEHPVGAEVELYGYSAVVSEDTAMMVGSTRVDGAVGGFTVARGFVPNPRQISLRGPGVSLQIGRGLDETWAGDLELADPVPTRDYPPAQASQEIADGFPAGGGYALLVQRLIQFESNLPGQLSVMAEVGGVELIRYGSRNGTRLVGVQRAQTLPGNDNQIGRDQYRAATARQFVTEWPDWRLPNANVTWNEIPTLILWVVPVSLPIQNVQAVWDPATTELTEWVQIYPQGNDNDTEWVRYDAIADNRHLVRGNRAAWESTRYILTQTLGIERVQVGQLGAQQGPNALLVPPWGTVAATSGHIGYTPQIESTFPQIRAARRALAFRGDPFTGTSSHPQNGSLVMPCQRLQLPWGNYGALSGRVGRHDRVALVQGSTASGTSRPAVEWHTCNWQAYRFNSDNLQQNRTPPERLGPWPFQLVAFRTGVNVPLMGPPTGTQILDPRQYDRVVKFPSGELPAAFCEAVHVGSAVGGGSPIRGFVDEIDAVRHQTLDLVLEEPFDASAREFRVVTDMTATSAGTVRSGADLSSQFPETGGLVWIGGEVIAYSARADGVFTVANNGRGLLNTEAAGHDRGQNVHFLTQRPAAILSSGVGARDDTLVVQGLGRLPTFGGALRLGGEILHYTWARRSGDQVSLEMPRWYPAGRYGEASSARGLFRGRFGTSPAGASSGEAVIHWPIRYWDRHAESSDDPELAYFQLTTHEAPSFYRGLRWREETRDSTVDVECTVRTDPRVSWTAEPSPGSGLTRFRRSTGDDRWSRLAAQASRLELRFATVYEPGAIDLQSYAAHAWKTTVRIDDVRVDYEGQLRILDEKVTAR
jgi:hypothetical protein